MHIPVLLNEVIKHLNPKPNENFIDCTFGLGGHSKEILKRIKPNGKVLGIEADEEIISKVKSQKSKDKLILVNDSYVNLQKIVKRYKFKPIHGILLDLGMSSWHLEESGRGFSFRRDEILDMRYDIGNSKFKIQNSKLTAEKIINYYPSKEIEKIIKEYGEERFARRIAKKIVEERKKNPIQTTFQLRDIIRQATPGWYHHKRLHFATKTFQALRIAVNNELENLKIVLIQILDLLEKEGRLVIISFHSLEDRIVKNFFRDQQKRARIKILFKKPITASEKEIEQNSRARSAKLRAAIKI